MIELRVLGPVELAIDGAPAPAPLLWRKHLALLVYLALAGDRPHSREVLVTLLWPDRDGSAGRHSLNEAIRVLRRAAGDDIVESTTDSVRLQPGHVRTDTAVMVAAQAGGDTAAAAALVRGAPFDGLAVAGASDYEDWLARERLVWRARSVDALVAAAELEARAGHLAAAVELSQRALAIAPGSDAAARQAMRALALADDRDAALELFGRFRQRLADDLGADPEPATLALADRLASRGERPQGNGGRGSRPAEGATHRHAGAAPAPLVGREAELASLLAAWSDVRGGEGARAAIIVGDPGTGRTRLLEELVARATLDGGGVTLARAVPADRSLEGAGLLAIARGGLATMAGVGAAAPEAHAALRERLPEWRERFPGPLGTDTSVGAAVTELVRAAAEDRAVLVALDDAQWIDEASLRALLALLRDIPRARLMLAATMTNGAISPALDELRSRIGRGTAGVTVTLRALGPAQVRALAGAWLPRYDDGALDRIVRRVVADSAGLPLLAVELLRAVAHGLELDESSEPWPAPAQTLDQTLPGDMPDSLSAAVRLASSRLGEDPRRVLAAASAGTGRVTLDALAEAAALPRDRVAAALDELEWTRWLVWDARGYTFTARVVREIVARDLLTPGQRRRLGEVLRAAAAEGG